MGAVGTEKVINQLNRLGHNTIELGNDIVQVIKFGLQNKRLESRIYYV